MSKFMSQIPPKLHLENVTRTFRSGSKKIIALDNVDLSVAEGEFVCLLGESGCGKSTLLHLIAGLDQPTSGRLLLDGIPIQGSSKERPVVFQSPLLFPWLDVEQNIGLGLSIQGKYHRSTERIKELTQMIGLTGFEKMKPHELSGGMAQRVALARALAPAPSMLLLDEPYSALDSFTRMHLQQELHKIWQERKLTIIFVTHDIDEAVFLGTKLVIMSPRPGRIARVIRNTIDEYPRHRDNPELFRVKQMIAQEFTILREERLAETINSEIKEPVNVQ